MALKTFTAPTRDDTLGLLLISNNAGTGFTLTDAGIYTLRASLPWYHATTDNLDIGAMTAVDAGDEVTITVTDTPVTWFVKIEHVNDLVPLTFKFATASGLPTGGTEGQALLVVSGVPAWTDLPAGGVSSDANGNTKAGTGVLSALTDGTNNTAIGENAGNEVTSGDSNVLLGKGAGHGLGDISNWFIVGSNSDPIAKIYIAAQNGAHGVEWQNHNRFEGNTIMSAQNAVVDGNLIPSSIQFFIDEGSDKLTVRVKYGDSSLKTGSIDLV